MIHSEAAPAEQSESQLSRGQCLTVLITAFLGWLFAGIHLAITALVMRVGASDLLRGVNADNLMEGDIGKWFGWLVVAFLFGAAAGGYLLGYVGDRLGRAKAMAISILCYSIFSGLTYFAQTPMQLLLLRFLTCMGIGGMWPNGIALVSEAWPNISRPFLAGAIGTAANVGILLFAILTCFKHVTIDDWRWTMIVGALPLALGLLVLVIVPESPRWLAVRKKSRGGGETPGGRAGVGIADVFRPPILKMTLIGILLGTVPLFGGWGVANWANAWASEVGDTARNDDPALKSRNLIARSLPGSFSSLMGGALALALGRRRTYFLLSLGALICTQVLFRLDSPTHPQFLFWNGMLGFFSGFFFGWLPLCLPELFPTRVRSTGAGVSFNFGRILTGIGVLIFAAALKQMFSGHYAEVGQVSGLVYALGMIVIFFAPDTSEAGIRD